ncbi:MAG: bifunctional acetaldehyde-CoA/alcohol dehydrogenase, partial [Cetobacterium sp.]
LADYLGFTKGNETPEEKAKILRKKISELKTEIGIKSTIAEYGISEQEFLSKLDQMVEDAFDDQCTGANPRYPLMSDLKEMYLRAYYGPEKYLAMQKKSEEKSEKKAK